MNRGAGSYVLNIKRLMSCNACTSRVTQTTAKLHRINCISARVDVVQTTSHSSIMRCISNAEPRICTMTQIACTSMLSIGRAVLAGRAWVLGRWLEDIKTTGGPFLYSSIDCSKHPKNSSCVVITLQEHLDWKIRTCLLST